MHFLSLIPSWALARSDWAPPHEILAWSGLGVGDVALERQVLRQIGVLPKQAVDELHSVLPAGWLATQVMSALTGIRPNGSGAATPKPSGSTGSRGRSRSKQAASKVGSTPADIGEFACPTAAWVAPGDVPPLNPATSDILEGSKADKLLREVTERACSDLVAVRACVRATALSALKLVALVRGMKLHRLLAPYREGIKAVLYDAQLHYLPPVSRLGVLYSMLTCLRADPEHSIIPVDTSFVRKLKQALDLIRRADPTKYPQPGLAEAYNLGAVAMAAPFQWPQPLSVCGFEVMWDDPGLGVEGPVGSGSHH